ncbi:hypothetical protein SAVIM338S_02407 [Streptomyces avidinii]
MRRIGWTAGAVLGALLVTGCGPDGPAAGAAGGAPASASATGSASAAASGPATPAASAASGASGAPGAFGRKEAAADIAAATTATGLPQPEEDPSTASPAPSPGQSLTAEDERRAEIFECMAPWQTMEQVAKPEEAYAATIAVLEQRGWKIDGKQLQQDMLTQTKLKKQGWILFARRYDFSHGKGPTTGMPDMLSFFASDLACEGRFTDTEMTELLKDG